MPYLSLSEVPSGFKSVAARPAGKPIPLTLSQANKLAQIYDSILEETGDKEKAARFAKATFRKAYKVEGGKWVVKNKGELRESVGLILAELQEVGKRHSTGDNQMREQVISAARALLNNEDIDEEAVEKLEKKAGALKESLEEAAKYKTENGIQFPAEAYAYVPDPDSPSTWKLRLWEDLTKKVTAKQVGAAISAFSPGGHRGQKVQIPADDVAKVKAKVRTAWKKANPEKDPDSMPAHMKESAGSDDEPHPKDRTAVLFETSLSEATYDKETGDLICDLIQHGENDAKPRYYTERAIQEAAPLYADLRMFLDHPTEKEKRDRPERSVKDWVSTVMEAQFEDGVVKGRVHVHDPWLRERLADPIFRSKVGLSHVADGFAHMGEINGKRMQIIESIKKVKSVDWVTEAAQGGKVAQMFESRREDMAELETLTLEDLKAKRGDLVKAILEESKKDEKGDPKKTELEESLKKVNERIAVIEGQFSKASQKAEVERIVKEAKLSDRMAGRVVSLVESRTFEDDPETVPAEERKTALQKLQEATQEAIKEERKYVADVSGKPQITGDGGKPQTLVESVQKRMDKRFGVSDVKLEESQGPKPDDEKKKDEAKK